MRADIEVGGEHDAVGGAAELIRRAPTRTLCGWGRTAPSRARVVEPGDGRDLAALLAAGAELPGGMIARGAGRSYGDAAQNRGGLVLDTARLSWIGDLDEERLTVRAGAGTTLAELMRFLVPRGLTVPVTPGTKYVSVGGAIAADIHGKNHHRDGSFSHHVESISLSTPAAGELRATRQEERPLFDATIGGMGLTGVITEATLRIDRPRSTALWADIDRTDDLDGALALMAEEDPRHRFTIAWVDLLGDPLSRGRRGIGRSVVVRSDYAEPAAGADGGAWHASPVSERPRQAIPRWFPGGVLNTTVAESFNALRWRTTPSRARERPIGLNGHFFPLDAVGHWNRLYGRHGFVQYQFVVPRGQETTLIDVVEHLCRARMPMYLVVLKRFGEGSGGYMSFPLAGFTLAIDIPAAAPGLHGALARADELVAGAGGRVYLAKDARLSAESLAVMYPDLDELEGVRSRVDPDGVLKSDLARRVGLCGANGGRTDG
ncbi:MAG: FAD-binding protein [Solirubrobacteraceae bacterium]